MADEALESTTPAAPTDSDRFPRSDDNSGPWASSTWAQIKTTLDSELTAAAWSELTGTPADNASVAAIWDTWLALTTPAGMRSALALDTENSPTFTGLTLTGAADFSGASSVQLKVGAGYSPTINGHVGFDSTAVALVYGANAVTRQVVNTDEAQILTSKTINGASNTITNVSSLATDALDLITEIAAAIRTGGGTFVVTGTTGTPTANDLVMWDADGDAIASGVQFDSVLQTTDLGVTVQGYDADTMLLDVAQAVTGEKIFNASTLGLNDTDSLFDLFLGSTSTLTADRILTFDVNDAARTLTIGGDTTLSGGTHSGTNTGDQTDMSGISDSKADFNTALSDGSFAFDGGAHHDGFSDFVFNEHIDHTSVTMEVAGTANEITSSAGAQDISANRTWTIGLADNPTVPGGGTPLGIVVPVKSTTGDPADTTDGRIYYNSFDNLFRGYNNGAWETLGSASGMTSFTAAGDSGGGQPITDGNTLSILGGTGITTADSATDTVTINHDAHTGDVTGSTALTIADEAVTYAKMQHVSATDKLLGRSTAGAGDVEEITCTSAGRDLLDDASAAAQATTLGLGTGNSPTFAALNLTANSNQIVLDSDAGGGVTTTITDSATAARTITLPDATGTLEMRGRYKYVYIPAGALTPDATDGATAGTAEINDSAGLGYTFDYLSFDYQTANDKASWTMMMPDDWDESTTLKFKPAWTVDPLAAAQPTSSTCHWDFRAIAKTDADSAGSGSWSSTVSSDDTYISQDTIHTGPASGALTVTGAAAGDVIIFEVTRDQAGDSLGINAWLMGIHMQYQQQGASDAAW